MRSIFTQVPFVGDHDRHVVAYRNHQTEAALRMIYEALGLTDNALAWNEWSRAAAEGAWQ